MRWIDFDQKKPTDAFPGWTPWTKEKWQAWLDTSATLLNKMGALNDEALQLARGDAVAALAKIKERNEVIDKNGSHWGALKEWLLAISHGKCWFSESKDIYSHYDVEHFRPKKEAKDDENCDGDGKAVTRDGYWWLAFDYTNFRICGNVGNRKKGGWFPLQTGSLCSTHLARCEESEAPYLLDPTDAADVDLVAYDEEGNIIPAPNTSDWEKKRVEVSVKRLKLNEHEALSEARKSVWQKVSREIDGYLIAKQKASSGANPAAREKLKSHIRAIRAMLQPDVPLSSVANWCLSFRNDPQLRKLVA